MATKCLAVFLADLCAHFPRRFLHRLDLLLVVFSAVGTFGVCVRVWEKPRLYLGIVSDLPNLHACFYCSNFVSIIFRQTLAVFVPSMGTKIENGKVGRISVACLVWHDKKLLSGHVLKRVVFAE